MAKRDSESHSRLFSFNDDGLNEVLEAVLERRVIVQPSLYSGRMLTFVSKEGVPANFPILFREFQTYIRARFGVRLIVVGGGVGCEKYTTNAQGAKADITLAWEKLQQADPALVARLRRMNIDFIIDEKTQQQVFVGVKSPFPAASVPAEDQQPLETVPQLTANIECLRQQLPAKLLPYANGSNLLKDYEQALARAYDSLVKPGLLDGRAFDALKSLNEFFERDAPEAFKVSDRIIGSLDAIAGLRLMQPFQPRPPRQKSPR